MASQPSAAPAARKGRGAPAIYVVSQRFHIDAIARLHPASLDVRLVVTRPALLAAAAGGFPGAVLYDILLARAGEWPRGEERRFRGVADAVLEELAPYEGVGKAMLDRSNWTGASLSALHQLYLRQAEIWDRYLREIDPAVVLFHGEPHRAFDWVLYGLCQRRGVPTGVLSFTHLEDRVLMRGSVEELLVADGPLPEAGRPEPDDFSAAPVHEVPGEAGEAGEAVEAGDNIVAPASFYMRETIPVERDTAPLRRRLGLRGTLAGGGVLTRVVELTRPYPAIYPNVVPDAPVTHLTRKVENVRVRRLIRRSIAVYEEAARTPPPDQPFAYYPLHFQPEATTLPMGGRLHDQLNNVRMLAAALPKGWAVVVKEHPQMLRFSKQWPRARGTAFYESLRAISHVRLAPIDHPSTGLSEQARVVATTTGTAGWEAVLRGKFVLAFGYPWFGTCPGVTRVGTVAACAAALEIAAAHGFANDKTAVQAWIDRFTRRCTFLGAFTDPEVEASGRPRDELAAATAEGVLRWAQEAVGNPGREQQPLG